MAVTREPITVLWLVEKFTSLSWTSQGGCSGSGEALLLPGTQRVGGSVRSRRNTWGARPSGRRKEPSSDSIFPQSTRAAGGAGSVRGHRGGENEPRTFPSGRRRAPPPCPAVQMGPHAELRAAGRTQAMASRVLVGGSLHEDGSQDPIALGPGPPCLPTASLFLPGPGSTQASALRGAPTLLSMLLLRLGRRQLPRSPIPSQALLTADSSALDASSRGKPAASQVPAPHALSPFNLPTTQRGARGSRRSLWGEDARWRGQMVCPKAHG